MNGFLVNVNVFILKFPRRYWFFLKMKVRHKLKTSSKIQYVVHGIRLTIVLSLSENLTLKFSKVLW